MPKIPLEATISGGFRFFFTRILSVLGTVWLPLLVTVVVWGGIVWLVVPHDWWLGNFPVIDKKNPDPAMIWALVMPIVVGMPLLMATGLVLFSMMEVGLLRLALDLKKRCFVFFDLGGDVWRVVWASVLSILFVFGGYAAVFMFAVGGGALAATLKPDGLWVTLLVIAVIAAACFAIYALVRLFFFLPAVIVNDHRILFSKSWRLGGGNFWRIVLVSLVISLAVSIVAGTASDIVIMSMIGSRAAGLGEHPTDAQMLAFLRTLIPLIPVFIGLVLIQSAASMGITAGAVGTAYKTLTSSEEAKS